MTLARGTVFTNFFAGGLTLAGAVENAGTINFNASGAGCQTDAIAIRSSVAGTQRSWNGAGVFHIVDADLQDQAGTALITAYSSTNSGNMGANWTFDNSCSVPTAAFVGVSGKVADAGNRPIARVRIELIEADGTARETTTNQFGYYQFSNVPAGSTVILNASHRRRFFKNPTIVFNVVEEIINADFIAY